MLLQELRSRVVCNAYLTRVAHEVGLAPLVMVASAEVRAKTGRQRSLLGNALEGVRSLALARMARQRRAWQCSWCACPSAAVIGAVYLDQGLGTAAALCEVGGPHASWSHQHAVLMSFMMCLVL
jgi:dsRNA-specific ribonuclease